MHPSGHFSARSLGIGARYVIPGFAQQVNIDGPIMKSIILRMIVDGGTASVGAIIIAANLGEKF